jgi:hypothetical protein
MTAGVSGEDNLMNLRGETRHLRQQQLRHYWPSLLSLALATFFG